MGTVVYSLMLDERGGIRSDLTIARLGPDRFQVGANGQLDLDLSSAARGWTGAWPSATSRAAHAASACGGRKRARCWRRSRTRTCRTKPSATSGLARCGSAMCRSPPCGCRTSASSAGSCTRPRIWASKLWDTLWAAGREHGLIAAGRGAFGSLRLEKGYRSSGVDMTTEHDPYEAGLGFAVRMDKGDFVGRARSSARAPRAAERRLVPLIVGDPAAVVMGKEPVHVDGRSVGYVTSAGFGYSIGSAIAYAWLPATVARHGRSVTIRYFDEDVPATVAEEPLFDPAMRRLGVSVPPEAGDPSAGTSHGGPDLTALDAVIFDKDGTLIDFHAMWGGWARRLGTDWMTRSGRPVSPDVFATIGFDPSTGRVAPGGRLATATMAGIEETVAAVLRRWCPSIAAARRATEPPGSCRIRSRSRSRWPTCRPASVGCVPGDAIAVVTTD